METQLNVKLLVAFETTVCSTGRCGKNFSVNVGIIETRAGEDEDDDEESVKGRCVSVNKSGGTCVL